MKLHYCFLKRFNNYFNRKVILYDNLEDYQNNAEDYDVPMNQAGTDYALFDFNPNDHVATEVIANEISFDPDYLVVFDPDGEVVSRWFVLEMVRTREGQWRYTLRRDVLAERYLNIVEAPVFVEKGIIKDTNSPILLNNEDVNVNQIKKEEILLKDITESAWLVMYLKKGVLGNGTIGPNNDGHFTLDVPIEASDVYQTLLTPIASWQFYQYTNSDYVLAENIEASIYFDDLTSDIFSNYYSQYVVSVPNTSTPGSSRLQGRGDPRGNLSSSFTDIKEKLDVYLNTTVYQIRSNSPTEFSFKIINNISKYNGKIIKDSDGKYFKVSVYERERGRITNDVTTATSPITKDILKNTWNYGTGQTAAPNDQAFTLSYNYRNLRIKLEELSAIQTDVDVSAYTGSGTVDSMLFDAICMPYGQITETAAGGISLTTSADRSMKVMNALAKALTSQYVLDLQLLPYCPIQNRASSKKLAIDAVNKWGIAGTYSGNTTDLFVVAPYANFTFDIEKEINSPSLGMDVPESYKVKYVNDCTKLRLCSPNYNGVFEMNLAKNGGIINLFNVDITLKPFNPYIHVNPDFSFVYGSDFNDVRGLICGGDFSLGIIDDAWNTYEIQNKNYQAIFDRQIQNLDVNNAIAKQEAAFGAVGGSFSGMASGAMTGLFATGNPFGGFAGALAGGGLSALGGILDIANLEKRQKEARSYAIDNYNLNLGNIKALPYSITKTSALTYNNKLFPFVEIYDCTDAEKEAYVNKIRWNGMTIGIVGKMGDYVSLDNSNYFRGKLIRLDTIAEDNHFLNAINEELLKGVYI